MNYPKINIINSLDEKIVIYDAFQNDENNEKLSNYFGTLTSISNIDAGKSSSFNPIHGPVSTYIVYDSKNNPITRLFSIGISEETFTVTQAELDIMKVTNAFIKFLQDMPENPQCITFQKILKDGKGSADKVNTFFQETTDYKACTFVSYMLAVVAIARTPAAKNKPPQEQVYLLSCLVNSMGYHWPSGFPDITVFNFKCSENNGALVIGGELNINDVKLADGVLPIVLGFLPSSEIKFVFQLVYNHGLATGSTCLKFTLDDIKIPIGNDKKFQIKQPTISLNINPLFKFVVFEVKGEIPFKVFNNPKIKADISMVIDNIEAEVGIELKEETPNLLTPPGMKGLHFDTFGVGLGLIFEPPGLAVGIEGTFHVGKAGEIPLNNDRFAIICEMEGEVPNPVYLSFYIPKLDIEEVITLFTNTTIDIDFPVSFQDLSVTWAENLMEPLVLPDGSLTQMAYGFSAYMDIFGIQSYGFLKIDISSGLSGDFTISPLNLGGLLKLSGNGKAICLKYGANGKPIPNNTIPKSATDKKAITEAKSKQIIKAGGPSMTLKTSSSPYFSLDGEISLFELIKEKIDAKIGKNGISFELDYGAIIQTKMYCCLKDYHNFSGKFSYGIDLHLKLPKIAGCHLGSIHLDSGCDLSMEIKTSKSDVQIKVKGGFHFEGLHLTFGSFKVDNNISSLSSLLQHTEKCISNNVNHIFKEITSDALKWAKAVNKEVVIIVDDVGDVLKKSFNKLEHEVVSIMRDAGFRPDQINRSIAKAFNDAGKAINDAAKDTGNAINDAAKDTGKAINDAAKDTGKAISHWDHWS